MHPIDILFWVFFGSVALWVAWGFIRVFLDHNEFFRHREKRKAARHGAAGGSSPDAAYGLAGLVASDTAVSVSSDSTGSSDSGSGDSGGGDSGGGDFSGGGGEYGGGGSSGGW